MDMTQSTATTRLVCNECATGELQPWRGSYFDPVFMCSVCGSETTIREIQLDLAEGERLVLSQNFLCTV